MCFSATYIRYCIHSYVHIFIAIYVGVISYVYDDDIRRHKLVHGCVKSSFPSIVGILRIDNAIAAIATYYCDDQYIT